MPSKKDTQLVADLRAASARLTEAGAPDLAAAVDEVLAPDGWSRLRHALQTGTGAPNVPVHMPLVLRDAIQTAAKAAGDSLATVLAEGLEEFIAGRFSPAANAHRARRNTGLETGNLNVRIDAGLKDRFQTAAADRADELGYKPALGHIAKAWLIEKYDIPAVEKLAQG
ncbi:hypothetical protein [Streptomyces sp. NPDC059071]|uniref:hypothetical protein n=1 Tax=unclassified Streptomyces TaxID=2593676 RepID=UPI0036644BEF